MLKHCFSLPKLYFLRISTGIKLFAVQTPDVGLQSIAVSKTFHRLTAKCAGYHVVESRQARYGSRQVRVGTKRGAELASHIFRFDRIP